LQVRNMVRNHRLAKSIGDASWSMFRQWVEYFGKVYGRTVIAVLPQYTSQNCSTCGGLVRKSLSTRTHTCRCGCELDRDHNAALNILQLAHKSTAGHAGTHTPVESGAATVPEQSGAASLLAEAGTPPQTACG
jgi:putative transposase